MERIYFGVVGLGLLLLAVNYMNACDPAAVEPEAGFAVDPPDTAYSDALEPKRPELAEPAAEPEPAKPGLILAPGPKVIYEPSVACVSRDDWDAWERARRSGDVRLAKDLEDRGVCGVLAAGTEVSAIDLSMFGPAKIRAYTDGESVVMYTSVAALAEPE